MGFTNDTSSLTPIHSLQSAIILIQMNHYHEEPTNHSLSPLMTLTHMNLTNSSPSSTIPFNFNSEQEKRIGNEFAFLLAIIGSMPFMTAPFLNCSTYVIENYPLTLINGWYNTCPFMHDRNFNNDQLDPTTTHYWLKMTKKALPLMKKSPSSVTTHSKKGVML